MLRAKHRPTHPQAAFLSKFCGLVKRKSLTVKATVSNHEWLFYLNDMIEFTERVLKYPESYSQTESRPPQLVLTTC